MCETMNGTMIKRCFKIQSELLHNLNVTSNLQQDKIVFWNKYQIFIFDDLTTDQPTLCVTPDFIIHQVVITNNYVVCLDCNGNVHTISLKLKGNAQKRFKASFNPRENNVKSLLNCDLDYLYSIKLEFDTVFLCANKINNDFQSFKKVLLNFNDDNQSSYDLLQKYIVKAQPVTEIQYPNMNKIFKTELDKESDLLVISMDSISVYGTVANLKKLNDELNLTKLYKSCTKICDIQISALETLKIIIGLESGSFVIVTISKDIETLKTVHMNVSINKFCTHKDTIYYSDGLTFWKADKILVESELDIKQLSIKLIKDFIVVKDQIIATVYSNNIYVIKLINDGQLWNKNTRESKEYYPVNDLISNAEYTKNIMALINKNRDVLNKIQLESNYLLALGIAKNKSLTECLLDYELLLYNDFQDILKVKDVLLTTKLSEYLNLNSLLFLITVLPPKSLKVIELLNKLRDKIKLHVILSTGNRTLNTSTLAINDFSAKSNLLIPLKNENYTNINVGIKLIVNVKGGLNGNILLPTIISEKKFILNSEYFIKKTLNKSYIEVTNNDKTTDQLILEFAKRNHGNIFEMSEMKEKIKHQFSYYIKLPLEFKSKLKNNKYLQHFDDDSSDQVLKKIFTDEFVKGKNDFVWTIGNRKVKLKIVTEETESMLKISCEEIKIAWNIRLFFSKIFYGAKEDCQDMKILINQSHYTVVENTQRKLRKCLEEPTIDEAKVLEISDDIQANIVGLLPL